MSAPSPDTNQLGVLADDLARHLREAFDRKSNEPGTVVDTWLYGAYAALGWLTELEKCDVLANEPCDAETHSWTHYRPEQVDSYWIRCTKAGPHDEHEDSNTGLTWVERPLGSLFNRGVRADG